MANEEHVKLIKEGVDAWNAWRAENHTEVPDLSGADLNMLHLSKANLSKANLSKADLKSVDFSLADLRGANLVQANLRGVDLSWANLSTAVRFKPEVPKLGETRETQLTEADLQNANLSGAFLLGTNFGRANLEGVNLTGAFVGETTFFNDLGTVKGLEAVYHVGPSIISIDTLLRSENRIPETFLRGVGVPDNLITFLPSLGVDRPIEFYSSFISYSHRDEEFARRLHSRMREENLRVWYAPEELRGGKKLHEQIISAIQIHDKLLLILSEHSIQSDWVITEIRRARKAERDENRRKLFPIRLVDFDVIQKWECFDTDSGQDLAIELREYYIPDFSNWKNHDAFEIEFAKLLRNLKAESPSSQSIPK